MLGKIFHKSFDKRIFFVFAVFAIFFFLAVGMPTPPGLIYKASETYLESHPGYNDIKTGSINPALLEQNIDVYNNYLLSVIVLIALNILSYFFLLILSTVVVWNYIQRNDMSVSGYWRSALFNLCWLLFAVFLGVLSYVVFTFIGSIGASVGAAIANILFIISLCLLIVLTILFNYFLQKNILFVESFMHGLQSFKEHFWKLLLGIALVFVVVVISSMLFYIASISFALVTAIVAIVQLVGFAWFHIYVATLLESKVTKRK